MAVNIGSSRDAVTWEGERGAGLDAIAGI